jgi:hypothetical protein
MDTEEERRLRLVKATRKYQQKMLDDPDTRESFLNRKKEAIRKHRNTVRGRITYYTTNASKRSLVWNLSTEEATTLFKQPCIYCNKQEEGQLGGIDRRDNDRGYDPDNVEPCCWTCNMMKNTMSRSEFIAAITNIVRHQIRAGGEGSFEALLETVHSQGQL